MAVKRNFWQISFFALQTSLGTEYAYIELVDSLALRLRTMVLDIV